MTDHPTTFQGENGGGGMDWDDPATIHRKDDGQGVFDALKAIHRGTLAQMVAHIAALPAVERGDYVIQKAGDHRLDTSEIMALAARPDFPR